MKDYLDCDHCGGPAIESDERGYFTDGDGGPCITCGLHGWVTLDVETDPQWNISDDPLDTCQDPGCEECKETRQQLRQKVDTL